MHPHSSALLNELLHASETDRDLAAQRRQLLMQEDIPSSNPGIFRSRLGTGLAQLSDRLRRRPAVVRQSMHPSHS